MNALASILLSGALAATPWLALAPLIIVADLGVVAYSIVDLYKPARRVYGGNKTVWLIVILLIGMLVLVGALLGALLPGASNVTPLVILAPLIGIAIYLPVVGYFIVDLYKPERRVAGGDKTFWLVAILFIGVIGIAAYLLFGRER
jgi:phospholipase D-like protein